MHERTVRARTATGIVEGFTRDGVHRWRSIPYARAPVGSLRFRAPQPAQPWPGVRHCHTFANCAPQQRRYTVMGIGRYQTRSEDCLTLNVVTPEEPATQPLPVMVFIHGGGYILGSSATPIYDGAALARRGCVYVSVNYRLGALGCLDLSSLSTPQITLDSNVYLRDLVLALRWVHDNIAEFGGDPGNVTIFGESAGAHITATLLAVPAAKGLFARAISESPAAGMVRSREVAAEFAARFANLIGARTQDAANALMQASPAQLVEAQHHLIRQGMRKRLGAFPIGPVFGDDYLPRLAEMMRSIDYPKFLDRNLIGHVPLIGGGLSLLLSDGVYRGAYLEQLLGGLLADLGVHTFGDLRTGEAPEQFAWSLVVTASDLSRRRLVRIPWDLDSYGIHPDDFSVARAVHASSAIPFVFEPVRVRGATWVDGGLLSNFPVALFDRTDAEPRWPTFGIRLSARPGTPPTRPVQGPVSLGIAAIETLVSNQDNAYIDDPCTVRRTIFVPAHDVSPIDFDITAEQREALYQRGFQAGQKFLANWNYADYLADCGGPFTPSL